MQRNKKRYRLMCWAVAWAGVGSIFLLSSCGNRDGKASGMPGAPEVAVIVVKTQRIALTTELPGRTSPFRLAEIRPQVSGLIEKRLFTEGSDVKTGDLLYRIDPAPLQAALDNALAGLGRAEASLLPTRARAERFEELLKDKSVSQQDYDDVQGAYKQAQADVKFWKASADTARINLGYTLISSPISGRIGRSTVTDGAIVTAYQPMALAVVQQLDPIYVDVSQSTSDLLRLQKRMGEGQLARNGAKQDTVHLILEDGTSYPLEGTLQFRDISVDSSTATVILRMVFPNPKELLLPGMFVRAVIEEGVNENAILIPQQSVSRDPKGNPGVMVVDQSGKAQRKMLTLDRASGDQWIVSAGLEPGDRVIIEGLQRVRPGVLVKEAPLTTEAKENIPPGEAPKSGQKAN